MDVFVLLAGLASAFTSDVLFEEVLATDGDSFGRMSSELNTFSKLQTAPSFPANFPTVPANCTVAGGYTQAEAQQMLNYHNALRSCVGSPLIQWSCDLQKQAQSSHADCKFDHADSYELPLKSGENLASTDDAAQSALMWFSEVYDCPAAGCDFNSGHYTAMVWKGVTTIGCGKCAGKLTACQYYGASSTNMDNTTPNMGDANNYKANVPIFGKDWSKCTQYGIDQTVAKESMANYKQWGICNSCPS